MAKKISNSEVQAIHILFFMAILCPLRAQPATLPHNFEVFVYQENFESNELNGWASYPLWQDTAYDPNLRPGRVVPGDPNLSLLLRVTPYTPVDAYAGAQKKLHFYLLPSSSISLRYYLKSHGRAEYLKIRLAAGKGGTIDFVVDAPVTNLWNSLTVTWEDLARQNPKVAGPTIQISGLAVLAKFPEADPAMPIYFGLDDILIQAARVPDFEFIEPEMHKLEEWTPHIPKYHYHRGETLRIQGRWPVSADRVAIRVTDFAEPRLVVLQSQLRRRSGLWTHPPIQLSWPEGLYLAELEALSGSKKIATTEFTLFIAPSSLAGKHPRLWFDKERLSQLRTRLKKEERFQPVVKLLGETAREARGKLPLDRVIFDIDVFPKDEPLLGNVPRSIYPWFNRINPWRRALSSNALAFAFLEDKEAGDYAQSLLVKLASFPFWLHPWFESRGQHIYYPVGELGMDAALAYDLLFDRLTEEERRIIRAALVKNIVLGCHRSYVEDNLVTSNTSNWIAHITGGSVMSQAAIYGDGEDIKPIEPYFTGVLFKLHEFIQKSIGRDGGYGESYSYCNFTMESLSKALPALDNVFHVDFSGSLHLTHQDLAWATLLDKKFFLYFGDSSGNVGPMTNWAWLLGRRPDSLLGWLYHFFKKEETLFDLIYETDKAPRHDPFSQNPVRLFRDIGTTVFRSGWEKGAFVFILRTGPFYNHQHLDQGTFWLADGGEIFIAERRGSTYYDDPIYQSHYTQPIAHSTILIDRNAQSQRVGDPLRFIEGFKDHAFVDHFLDGQDTAFVSGDLSRLYWEKAQEIQRNVIYLKPRTILIVDKIVPGERDVDVTILFQAGAFQDIEAGEKASRIRKGDMALLIAHLWPKEKEIRVEETPLYLNTLREDSPLIREGMLTLTTRTDKSPLSVVNLLTTGKGEKSWDDRIEEGEGYCYGSIGNCEFLVSTRPGQEYSARGWSTDALALTWSAGSVFAALATSLASDGKKLLRSSEPITCEIAMGKIKYYLAKPGQVSIRQEEKPRVVFRNGQKIKATAWNNQTQEMTVTLPSGEGEISIRF